MEVESLTAKICAWARAKHLEESRVPIFSDALAGRLLDQKGKKEVENALFELGKETPQDYQRQREIWFPVPLSRSAWAEAGLKAFADGKSAIQYVVLGAGYDTFAWRNKDKRIRVYEVDHPLTQALKIKRVQELGWENGPVFVPVDFAKDSLSGVLLKAGFDPYVPSFFTILGVSWYLSLGSFEKTLGAIRSLMRAPARVYFDFPGKGLEPEREKELSRQTKRFGEPLARGYRVQTFAKRMKSAGFDEVEHLRPTEISKKYFQNRADGLSAYENVHFVGLSTRQASGAVHSESKLLVGADQIKTE